MTQIKIEDITLNVSDDTQMAAYVARPKDGRPYPGIMVFQEAFGVNSHIRDVTERFARLGYAAIAPDLYHRTAPGFQGDYNELGLALNHLKAMTVEGTEADLRATYGWLNQHSEVTTDNISSVGYCMGGRISFLANTILPLKVAVSYYGGGIAPTSLPGGGSLPGLLNRSGDLHGPILFFWGGADGHISTEQHRSVVDALTVAGKKFVDVEFSYADHAFFCDDRPSYNPTAAEQSWAMTLAFLASNNKT